uniref:Succinate dehydrogenase [ubiquinone] cytochrome b small subunit n=1 Tax=Cacopsylla melanoneura TaxID=428564 RepID=A0A8D8RLM9_9HEMI
MAFSTLSRNAFNSLRGINNSASLLRFSTQSQIKPTSTSQISKALSSQKVTTLTPALARHFSATSVNLSPDHAKSDHTTLWTIERFLSAGLLAVIPAAYLVPSAALEYALVLSIVMHSHWGIEALVVDYARAEVVGAAVAKVSHLAVYILSIITLAGLMNLILNGGGIVDGTKKLWALKSK